MATSIHWASTVGLPCRPHRRLRVQTAAGFPGNASVPGCWYCSADGGNSGDGFMVFWQSPPNNSFKPNLFRYGKSVATKACHAFPSTAQVGLIQALGDRMIAVGNFYSFAVVLDAVASNKDSELNYSLYWKDPDRRAEPSDLFLVGEPVEVTDDDEEIYPV